MTILTNEINVCELSKENKKIKKKDETIPNYLVCIVKFNKNGCGEYVLYKS